MAVNSVFESSETRHLGRMNLNDESGNYIAVATESTLGAINTKIPASDNGGVPVTILPRSSNAYSFAINLIPTTLTSGTDYVTIHNGGSTKSMRIKRMRFGMTFTGTAAAGTRSTYGVFRYTAGTPSGGTVGTALSKATSNAATGAVVRYEVGSTGVTTGALTVEGTALCFAAHPSQNNTAPQVEHDFTDAPIILAPGEGILIRAVSGIVNGSANAAVIEWDEV